MKRGAGDFKDVFYYKDRNGAAYNLNPTLLEIDLIIQVVMKMENHVIREFYGFAARTEKTTFTSGVRTTTR